MIPDAAIEANPVLAFSGIGEDNVNSKVNGFIRIKAVDGISKLPNHIMLILDLSASMHKYLTALRESIEKIVEKLNIHTDKFTILGFAGMGGVKSFCEFTPVSELSTNFSRYIPKNFSTLTGTTDFNAGLLFACEKCNKLSETYHDSYPNKGNSSMRWNEHNHIAIFMTDGRSYGGVPWDNTERLADKGVTLHTIGIRKEIDSRVRTWLMKMARKGRGGFNFSKNVVEFHDKVRTLLELSLGAVTKPAKLSLEPASGVKINSASILGHPEQNTKETNPNFEFPALRPGERKIVMFDITVTEPHIRNTMVPLIRYKIEPNYLDSVDNEILVPVMPKEIHTGILTRGPNADFRVHLLMQRIERDLTEALDNAAKTNEMSEFKKSAMASLSAAEETIERSFGAHPKRSILSEKISELKEQISLASTIVDSKAFFSTIYAIMRTTR